MPNSHAVQLRFFWRRSTSSTGLKLSTLRKYPAHHAASAPPRIPADLVRRATLQLSLHWQTRSPQPRSLLAKLTATTSSTSPQESDSAPQRADRDSDCNAFTIDSAASSAFLPPRAAPTDATPQPRRKRLGGSLSARPSAKTSGASPRRRT